MTGADIANAYAPWTTDAEAAAIAEEHQRAREYWAEYYTEQKRKRRDKRTSDLVIAGLVTGMFLLAAMLLGARQ
jgi:hypothetical protein